MHGRCLKLTIPKDLYDESMTIVREKGYSNLQELAKESLRKKVWDLKLEQQISRLESLKGSAKPRPRLTNAQRDKIAREHTPEKSKFFTKKYGLEKFTNSPDI